MIKNFFKNVEKYGIRLLGINNAKDFVETINDADEFIMVDVNKNTSSVEDNYRNKVMILCNKFSI